MKTEKRRRERAAEAKRSQTYLGVNPHVDGVPLPVVHRGVHRQLELTAPAIEQHLRPPLPHLYGQEGRGRPPLATGEGGREGAGVQDEGVGALGEEAEGYGGGEARGEGLDPHPACPREGAGEDLALRAVGTPGAHAPGGSMG